MSFETIKQITSAECIENGKDNENITSRKTSVTNVVRNQLQFASRNKFHIKITKMRP